MLRAIDEPTLRLMEQVEQESLSPQRQQRLSARNLSQARRQHRQEQHCQWITACQRIKNHYFTVGETVMLKENVGLIFVDYLSPDLPLAAYCVLHLERRDEPALPEWVISERSRRGLRAFFVGETRNEILDLAQHQCGKFTVEGGGIRIVNVAGCRKALQVILQGNYVLS